MQIYCDVDNEQITCGQLSHDLRRQTLKMMEMRTTKTGERGGEGEKEREAAVKKERAGGTAGMFVVRNSGSNGFHMDAPGRREKARRITEGNKRKGSKIKLTLRKKRLDGGENWKKMQMEDRKCTAKKM